MTWQARLIGPEEREKFNDLRPMAPRGIFYNLTSGEK